MSKIKFMYEDGTTKSIEYNPNVSSICSRSDNDQKFVAAVLPEEAKGDAAYIDKLFKSIHPDYAKLGMAETIVF